MGFLDTRHALVQPLKCKGHAVVIDPQLVEDRRVQIPYMDRIVFESGRSRSRWIDDVVAVVIRLAMNHAPFDSTPGTPSCKTPRMMIPTIIFPGRIPDMTEDRGTRIPRVIERERP